MAADFPGFVLRFAANEDSIVFLGLPGRSSQPWRVKAGSPASLYGSAVAVSVLRFAANEDSVVFLGLPGRSSLWCRIKVEGPASPQGLRRGRLRPSLRCERSLVEAGGVEPPSENIPFRRLHT